MKDVYHPDWLVLVGAAPDPTEVVKISLTFLSKWTSDQRGSLPKSLQPPLAIHTPQNISDYAFALVQGRLKDAHPTAELDAMTSFFAAAATRLSQLLTVKGEGYRVPFFMRDI